MKGGMDRRALNRAWARSSTTPASVASGALKPRVAVLLSAALKRWQDEERRLFQHMKIMKTRAAQNFKNATKANAAETRWEKFVAAGPPPPPVPDQQIKVRLRGGDAARRVAKLEGVSIGDLFLPFSDEVHHG